MWVIIRLGNSKNILVNSDSYCYAKRYIFVNISFYSQIYVNFLTLGIATYRINITLLSRKVTTHMLKYMFCI